MLPVKLMSSTYVLPKLQDLYNPTWCPYSYFDYSSEPEFLMNQISCLNIICCRFPYVQILSPTPDVNIGIKIAEGYQWGYHRAYYNLQTWINGQKHLLSVMAVLKMQWMKYLEHTIPHNDVQVIWIQGISKKKKKEGGGSARFFGDLLIQAF